MGKVEGRILSISIGGRAFESIDSEEGCERLLGRGHSFPPYSLLPRVSITVPIIRMWRAPSRRQKKRALVTASLREKRESRHHQHPDAYRRDLRREMHRGAIHLSEDLRPVRELRAPRWRPHA
jgi:hypothetical protein